MSVQFWIRIARKVFFRQGIRKPIQETRGIAARSPWGTNEVSSRILKAMENSRLGYLWPWVREMMMMLKKAPDFHWTQYWCTDTHHRKATSTHESTQRMFMRRARTTLPTAKKLLPPSIINFSFIKILKRWNSHEMTWQPIALWQVSSKRAETAWHWNPRTR